MVNRLAYLYTKLLIAFVFFSKKIYVFPFLLMLYPKCSLYVHFCNNKNTKIKKLI